MNEKKKILVNATTIKVGGAIQVAISFIEKALNENTYDWRFLISKEVYSNLNPQIKNRDNIIVFNRSPSELINGYKTRKSVKDYEFKYSPNLIYSIGHPSYIKFENKVLARFTDPWIIYSNKKLPWEKYDAYQRLLLRFKLLVKKYWSKKADYYETQTESAKISISQNLSISPDKIFVVPNSANHIFTNNEGNSEDLDNKFRNENIILSLSADYPHKNLDIIPKVIYLLRSTYNLETFFILTIPFSSAVWENIKTKASSLKVFESIKNIGPQKLSDCPNLYSQSKITFLPTLLEVFSATYLESMAMGKPIVTTDMEFARGICEDAAIYFKPNDAEDASKKIYNLITNKDLYSKLVNNGNKIIEKKYLESYKYDKLFNMIDDVINREI